MGNKTDDQFAALEEQLILYADDLVTAVRGRDELEATYKALSKQLVSFGTDFRTIYDDLAAQLQLTKAAYIETIHRLSLAAEFKDKDTGYHIERMSRYSALLSKALGFAPDEAENVLYASPMHDIGKIGIPDRILLKPGKLTDYEFEVMSEHTIHGAKILEGSDAKIIQLAHTIALCHHEKWNGKGYPHGLDGENIPLVARIVAQADIFDALTSRRPYKDPYPVDVAVQIIKTEQGESLDPEVVEAFLENLDEILEVRRESVPDDHVKPQSFKLSERDKADGLEVDGAGLMGEADA